RTALCCAVANASNGPAGFNECDPGITRNTIRLKRRLAFFPLLIGLHYDAVVLAAMTIYPRFLTWSRSKCPGFPGVDARSTCRPVHAQGRGDAACRGASAGWT